MRSNDLRKVEPATPFIFAADYYKGPIFTDDRHDDFDFFNLVLFQIKQLKV